MKLHLVVLHDVLLLTDRSDPAMRLVEEGRFGCDYAWNEDFTAYRCMPHRWRPGSDESYLAYQAGDLDNE